MRIIFLRRPQRSCICAHQLPASPPNELHVCASSSCVASQGAHIYTVARRHPKVGMSTHCPSRRIQGVDYVRGSASPPQGWHTHALSPCAAPKGVAY